MQLSYQSIRTKKVTARLTLAYRSPCFLSILAWLGCLDGDFKQPYAAWPEELGPPLDLR